MLYNDEERALMAVAKQPNMRTTNIAIRPFENIIDDFSLRGRLAGRVLDIGPGQCDFLDLARKAGAVATMGVDFDPAICSLGTSRGHEMVQAHLQRGWPKDLGRHDGIFCRGSINVYWFRADPRLLDEFLSGIGSAIREASWAWIAPWNSPGANATQSDDSLLSRLDAWSAQFGIDRLQPGPLTRARYGIGYQIPRVEIWVKGLVSRAPLED